MDYLKRAKELNQTFGKLLEECPELTFVGNPVLRQKTGAVSLEEGLEIAEKLKRVLLKYREIAGFGRGLAAPQIGEAKSIFVTYVDDTFKTYLNPRLLNISDQSNFYRESCLSCGYLSVDVKRPASVEIEYMDEFGETKKEQTDSFLARLLQHEYDHLEGVVNIDRAEPGSIEFMFGDPLKEQLREVK